MDPGGLLIIAGAGQYPRLLAAGARKAGVKRLAVLAFRGQTDRALCRMADLHARVGVGELSKAIAWGKSTGIRDMVLAGQITPAALFTTRFDPLLLSLMRGLKVKSAHTIFGALVKLLEGEGFNILPASTFMEDYIPAAGVLTSRAPDEREEADIRHGQRAAMAMGALDIGQTVVVKEGMVLAVEAFEGTNAAICRGAKLGGKGAVVVKVAREGHDMRFDIPVVGAKTLRVLRRGKISALAFQAGRTILLDREEVLREADRHGIAIVALRTELPPAPTRP